MDLTRRTTRRTACGCLNRLLGCSFLKQIDWGITNLLEHPDELIKHSAVDKHRSVVALHNGSCPRAGQFWKRANGVGVLYNSAIDLSATVEKKSIASWVSIGNRMSSDGGGKLSSRDGGCSLELSSGGIPGVGVALAIASTKLSPTSSNSKSKPTSSLWTNNQSSSSLVSRAIA
jgi:hypothetical protein